MQNDKGQCFSGKGSTTAVIYPNPILKKVAPISTEWTQNPSKIFNALGIEIYLDTHRSEYLHGCLQNGKAPYF